MKRKPIVTLVFFLLLGNLIGLVNLSTDIAEAGTTRSGTISSDETWTLAGSPYWIEGDLIVEYGANLIIEPGVEVRFNEKDGLFVNGNLSSIGSEANRIIFTTNSTFPILAGNWNRIQINPSGHAEIKHVDILYGYYGIYIDSSSNNTIENCNVSWVFKDGIHIESSSNNSIANNDVWYNYFYSIYLESSSNNTLANNTISGNLAAIHLDSSSHGNVIINNTLIENDIGVYVGGSSNRILNNIISNNGYGLKVTSSYNPIANNTILNNDIGIDISGSLNNIVDNELYENRGGIHIHSEYGIETSGSSNIIFNNNLYDNPSGIRISSSDKIDTNIIYNNNLIYSSISISDSLYNRIYKNNFIDEGQIVFSNYSSRFNYWNDSYPSGGNFWSGYSLTCIDNYGGNITPQTAGAPDGICDNQFEIDENNIDYFPLKAPIEDIMPVDSTPPNASVSPNITAYLGEVTILYGGASKDNVGIINYTWNITKDGSLIAKLYGKNPNYTFNCLGMYNATVTVEDYSGNKDSDNTTIIVQIRIPFDDDYKKDGFDPRLLCWSFFFLIVIIVMILYSIYMKTIVKRERKDEDKEESPREIEPSEPLK